MGSLHHRVEVRAGAKDFSTGLLNDLLAALQGLADGDLLSLHGPARLGPDLDRWARFTGNAIVEVTPGGETSRFLVRKGAPRSYDEAPVVGSRLWLYTNFDCNLACDYCCVRSSPRADPQALPLEDVQRAASEAPGAGVRELFVTGGEPFLRSDIAEVLLACAQALPTVVLTNGLLFAGKRRLALRGLPRDRVILQISLDSPTPALHDRHRGAGTWEKARAGIAIAREEGFHVRLASTVTDDQAEAEFQAFVVREGIPEQDCVLRRVAQRGFAEEGVALSRADLVPEVTLTRAGVYWHPVGATDQDFFVTARSFPLVEAIEAVRAVFVEERRFATSLANVFRCA
jgi:pyruvate-formate lyase-activating enzyme